MALTLEQEKRLESVGLIKLYREYANDWNQMAQRAYEYAKVNFPEDSPIRRDDVAKFLAPTIEVDEEFMEFRSKKKLSQKYWVDYFSDLIIDRCWEQLTDPEAKEAQQ